MKKLDFKFNVNDLEGKKIDDAKKFVSMAIISEKQGDAVKYFDWAMKIQNEGIIEVDDSDFEKIKGIITNTEVLTMLSKGQILKYLITIK